MDCGYRELFLFVDLVNTKMRDQLAAQIEKLMFALIVGAVVLLPLVFLPLFSEFYDTTKLIVLVTLTLAAVFLWSLSWVVRGKVLITRTPLDIPLLLVALVIVLSAILSQTQYVAIFGAVPRFYGSAVSILAYILLYFVAVSHIKNSAQVINMMYAFIASSTIVAVLTLLSYFNLFLPLPFARFQGFTPTGSPFASAGLLIMVLPIFLYSLVRERKFLPDNVAVALATLFVLVATLVGRNLSGGLGVLLSPAYLGLAFVYLVVYLTVKKDTKEFRKGALLLFLPVIVSVVVGVISFLPMGGKWNFIKNQDTTYPREVQLPFITSWNVAASSMIRTPFLGTGPATFLYNFTAFKPAEFNNSPFWNYRFDSGYNEFLTVLSTQGILGVLAVLFFAAVAISYATRSLGSENTITAAVSLSALVAVLLLFVHTTTLVTVVGMVVFLAILMALNKASGKVEEISLGIRTSKLTDSNLVTGDILPIVVFIPVFIFVIYAVFKTSSIVMADYNHRLALNAVATRPIDTYNYLVAAENLNPNVDLYRSDLAQTNLAIANAIASSKAPTEASPSGSLSDQDKIQIQQLIQQAIREAQIATALNPRNSLNFEILANIYRQLTGVAENALLFALNAYGGAVRLDPTNPLLRFQIGSIYLGVQNYDLAIRFFQDAINLKPDYANAYYNLSVALRDKGDLVSAQQVAEQLVSLLSSNTNNPDYKLSSDYLSDLKARIATGSANQSQIGAQGSTSSGALQQTGVGQNLNLGNPPQEATPAPVKR